MADTLLLVITEDPSSLTDAYAVLKLLLIARAPMGLDVRVVVNMAGSVAAGLRAYETLAAAAFRVFAFSAGVGWRYPAG